MGFITYKQADSRWGKKNYNGSSTMAAAGCGPTSCAMIAYGVDGKTTPLDTMKYMQTHGDEKHKTFALYGNGTAWNGITQCLKYFGVKDVQIVYNMAKVFELMSKGYVGIFRFQPGSKGGITWTTSGHYITVTGYKCINGKHYIYTRDSGGKNHTGWYCYETQMRGLLADPAIWLGKVEPKAPTTYGGEFPTIPVCKIGEAAGKMSTSAPQVREKKWYSFGQTHCFQFKDKSKGLAAAKLIQDACANDYVLYDSSTKDKSLSFRKETQKLDWNAKKIAKKVYTACSQLCLAGVMSTGINVNDYKNSAGLITELQKFPSDFYDRTSSGYLTKAANLYEGDILVKAKKHAIMVVQGEHLRIGNSGENVKRLQKFLNWAGFDCGTADGIFGENTLKSVKTFQKSVGLTASGYFGKPSLKKAKGYTK